MTELVLVKLSHQCFYSSIRFLGPDKEKEMKTATWSDSN